jgi:hypothetical protein
LTDLEFHGFMAKKFRLRDRTYITASLPNGIEVGTEITSLNGTILTTLTPTALSRLFESRLRRLVPTVYSEATSSAEKYINDDAARYSKELDQQTKFCICALCGENCF